MGEPFTRRSRNGRLRSGERLIFRMHPQTFMPRQVRRYGGGSRPYSTEPAGRLQLARAVP